MSKNRLIAVSSSNILLKDTVVSDGGTGSGPNIDLLQLTLDLTGYENYLLWVDGHTAISEDGNTANTSRCRIFLKNSGTSDQTTICGSRQGIGVYSSGITNDQNMIAHLSATGYFVVTSTYATNCALVLNGGIDNGNFHWGDQGSYTNFDGENLGASLKYILYRQ